MTYYITSLTASEFETSVNIRFDSILYGFDNYTYSNLTSNLSSNLAKDTAFINFISYLFHLNGNELIVDFFINKLSQLEKNNLRALLIPEDKLIFDNLLENIDTTTPYFKITDISLIPFFTRLSTKEVFFCTIYFINIPLTVWGNYNYTFPCFSDSENNINKLKEIAKQYSLEL